MWVASPVRRGAAELDPHSDGGSPGVRTRMDKRSASARRQARTAARSTHFDHVAPPMVPAGIRRAAVDPAALDPLRQDRALEFGVALRPRRGPTVQPVMVPAGGEAQHPAHDRQRTGPRGTGGAGH